MIKSKALSGWQGHFIFWQHNSLLKGYMKVVKTDSASQLAACVLHSAFVNGNEWGSS